VLPLKLAVLYPKLLMPLIVGRPNSLAAVEAALATEGTELLLVAQKDPAVEVAGPEDLYEVGTSGVIKKMSRQAEGDDPADDAGHAADRVAGYEQREPSCARSLHARIPWTRPDHRGRGAPSRDPRAANRALVLGEPTDLNEIQQVYPGSEDRCVITS
jgi:ATP-dependent Lon protease